MALTDKAIQARKPTDKKYKVPYGDGLHVVVLPNGGRYWFMQYHFNGRPEQMSFGTYPRASLKQARENRDEVRRKLASGVSPRSNRQKEKPATSIVFTSTSTSGGSGGGDGRAPCPSPAAPSGVSATMRFPAQAFTALRSGECGAKTPW